ncbi:MAG: O-antigen ligase family protein [Lachnospiraceae bacterium]
MGKNQTKKQETESIQRQFAAVLVYIAVFTLFLVYLPLVHNGYTDIQDFKSYFINWVLGIMVGACTIVGISWLCSHHKELTKSNMQKWLKSVTPSGWFLTALLFAAVVSFLATSYKTESLWGLRGRRFGFYMLVMCVLAHILIERFLNNNQYIILALLLSVTFVNIVCILNNMNIDVLHMYGDLGWQENVFTSTIGNVNSLAGMLAVVLPMAMAAFCFCKEKISLVIYGIFSVIACMTMVAVESDSIFLAIGVTFCILFWFTIDQFDKLRRFFILVAVFFVGCRMTGLTTQAVKGAGSLFGGLPALLGYTNKGLLLLPIVGICFALTFYLEKKPYAQKVQTIIKRIFAVCVIAAIAAVVILFILVNQQETKDLAIQKYHAFGSALFFDEMWGNWRGSNLRYTAEIFQKSSFFHKIFGYGPGNFYYAITEIFGEEIYINSLRMIDAHNDFLDFLINTGIVGAVGFFGFIFYNLYKYWKKAKTEDRTACTVVCLIAGYLVQGLVNNTLICVTPIFFLLLGVERSTRRKALEG